MPSSARDDTVILLPEKLFNDTGTPVGIDEREENAYNLNATFFEYSRKEKPRR